MDEKNDFLKVDEENKKGKNTVIIILGVAIVVLAIILTVVLLKAVASINNNSKETTRYELTSANNDVSTTDDSYLEDLFNNTDNAQQTSDSEEESDTTNKHIKEQTTKNQIIEKYEHLSVNGENLLSDHYENEFIQLISNNYDVDTELLVAVYSVPDSGTNFVLQFDGTKKRGKYVKSPDTLEKVYQIDIDRNVKVATGTATGNIGVSYPESVMCVAMVKTIVMEQYPNYFTGLE